MQSLENQYYKNLLAVLPIGFKPNTKVLSETLQIKPKRLARLLNGTANKVQVSELQILANHFNIELKSLFNTNL
jgi:hypothetical protein